MKFRLRRRGARVLLPLLATLGASLALLASAQGVAEAQESAEKSSDIGAPVIGLDVERAALVASDGLLLGGSGFAGRAGYLLQLPLIRLTPEVGYGYLHFDRDRALDDWSTYRFFVGARAGLGEVLVPSVFAHVGYAFIMTSDNASSHHASFMDFGGALDLHLIPHLGLGVHGAYETIRTGPHALAWLNVGLHGEIAF